MHWISRRGFLRTTGYACAAAVAARALDLSIARAADNASDIHFGMVTYQWGRDWDLPTLIQNLTKTGVLGVELRTTHAHKVEPNLTAEQRAQVKKRFADSPVKLIGLGTTEEFHRPDPAALQKSIEATKAFIKLSHDVGGTGVKVRPNDLPKNVPVEKTIEQIGKALNVVGAFGADYNQQIRLEVHGGCARLPVIKKIMDVATHPNVAVNWNSNNTDLEPPGLEANFNMVKDRLSWSNHVRQLDTPGYPWQDLITLFVKANFKGWLLLEAGGKDPEDRVAALAHQKSLFDQMLAKARAQV